MGGYNSKEAFKNRTFRNKGGSGETRQVRKRHPDPIVDYILNLQRTAGNKAVEGLIQRKAFDSLMNAGKVSAQEAKDTLNQLMQNKIFANDPDLIRHFSTCYMYMEPDVFTRFILPYKDNPDNIRSYYLGRLQGFGPGIGQGLLNTLTDIWDLLKVAGPAYKNKFTEIWDDPVGTFKRDAKSTIAGYKTFYNALHKAFKAIKKDPGIQDEILEMVNGVIDKKIAAFLKQWVEKNKTPKDQGYEIGFLAGVLVGEIIGAVVGGKGLLKIGKASKIAKLAKIAKTAKFHAILDKLGLGFLKKIINKVDDLVKIGGRLSKKVLDAAMVKIPSKYVDDVRGLIQKLPKKRQQEVIDLIERTYARLFPSMRGKAAAKTIQRHHWLLQSLQKEFKFLKKYGVDLVNDRRNIDFVVGHTGGHKGIYKTFVRNELIRLRAKISRSARKWSNAEVDIEIQKIIHSIKTATKNNPNLLTGKEFIILE